MGGFGIPELIMIAIIAVPVLAVLAAVPFLFLLRRRARRFGYTSTVAYLRAAPRSDAEKRDAADLAFKGLAWCVLGIVFAPCVLIGIVPLFYGGRKLVFASMGLGLVDDGNHSRA